MIPQTSKAPDVKLPLSFIVFGVVSYLLAQILLLTHGSSLAEGQFRMPAVWAAAHLLVIGWATMVSMGAMYQLVPVAFQVKIFSERMGHFQFWTMAAGMAGLLFGFLTFAPALLILSGLVLLVGFFLFLVNMFLSLYRISSWNIMGVLVAAALLSLALTLLLGLVLVWQLATGIMLIQNHFALLYSHITLGLAGWFSLLIFGFSYKLVPMFTLSHGYSMELGAPVLWTFIGGLLCLIAAYFAGSANLLSAGALLLFLAFALFGYHIWLIWQRRMKRHPDLGFKYALYAIIAGIAGSFLFAVVTGVHAAHGLSMSAQLTAVVYFFIMGCVSLSILGYLFKSVPFLWWTHKYRGAIGKVQVPTLKEMMDERLGTWFFPAYLLGVLLVFAGLWFESAALFLAGQGLHVLAAILYAWIILKVFKR